MSRASAAVLAWLPRWLAVTALSLLGLTLRLVELGRESLWLDEAGRVAIAALPLADIPHAVAVVELSPPLYHFVLWGWMGVAGDGDTAVRVLSALLILPAVPLAVSLGEAASGRPAGLVLGGIVAINPFAVHFGQEAAMYALLLPLSLVVLRAALGAWSGSPAGRGQWLAAYTVGGVAALYTHYYAAFLLASVGLVGLFTRRRSRHGLMLWGGAHLLMGLAFVPWAPTLAAQARLAASVEEWGSVGIGAALMRWAGALLADGHAGWSSLAGVILLGAGLAHGSWTLLRRRRVGASEPTETSVGRERASEGTGDHWAPPGLVLALLLTVTLLPLGLAILAAGPLHSFRERGFLTVAAAPWLLLAIAVAGGEGSRRSAAANERRTAPPRLGAITRTAVGAAFLAAMVAGLLGHFMERKESWREAAALVAADSSPTDTIFFVHYGAQLAFDRYFDGPQARIGLPDTFAWSTGYTARYRVTPDDVARRVPNRDGRWTAWAVLSHDAGRGSEHLLGALEQRGRRTRDVQLYGVRVLKYEL